MEQIKKLIDRIISRVNVNLNEFDFQTDKFVEGTMDFEKMLKFYAFYGITSQHPIYFNFRKSNVAGSYFLGKCYVSRSAIYKSDVRGDELKRKGDNIKCARKIPLVEDEIISIRDSLLYKTLVHSNSHNPESPEEFEIRNTISAHYSNIHGSTLVGCFLGAFSTVDLMNLHSCIVGEFSYIQTGELFHTNVAPGTVWVETPDFCFKYLFERKIIEKYIGLNDSHQPCGIINEFVTEKEKEFERLFEVVHLPPIKSEANSAVSRYAVVKGDTKIGENVLVAQGAFLNSAIMGKGSNAQENTYIINSNLKGNVITAHGGKIINSDVGKDTFVGFNSFLNGKANAKIIIGNNCIIMPHTIIDSNREIIIPDNHIIWGFIGSPEDVEKNSIPISEFEKVKDKISIGGMIFEGDASAFVNGFKKRINGILLLNGALFENGEKRGHAQDNQDISYNTIQPYKSGPLMGLYPSIRIKP